MGKSDRPLISIILPIYNVRNYLDKCMKSVLNQSYTNIDIVMVDDGSTDGCSEICEKYKACDSRVRVIHKANGGLSDARNVGINFSRGEYITFVDSDDYIDSDYVEYLLSLIRKYSAKMSVCQHRVIYENGRVVDYGDEGDEVISSRDCIKRMLYHDIIDTSAWAKLYHCSLFKGIQYPVGRIYEDIGTTYKLFIESESIAVGYESKYNYIIRGNSIVTGEYNIRKLDLLEMTDEMGSIVQSMFPDLEDAVLRRRVYARISTLNQIPSERQHYDLREEQRNFVVCHGRRVLRDRYTPMRDKIAIIALYMGDPVYRMLWNCYKK